MILETRHLRMVLAIAEHGTLTRASRDLFVTQSGLSHQLLTLEERLRTPLFHRLGKRMVPTPAGARLVEAAQRALPLVTAAEEDLERFASGQDAVIRLTTQCYTCYNWLPALLPAYRRRFPGVDVRLVTEATARPFEALLAGHIDLAVVMEEPPDDRLAYVHLFRDEVVAVMAPSHPLARKSFLAPADFAVANLLLYAKPRDSYLVRDILDPAGVRPRSMTQVQLTEGIIELAKAGAGIGILARWAVATHLGPALSAVRITRGGYRRSWSAAMVRQERPPAHLTEFAALLSGGPVAGGNARPARGGRRRRA